MKSDLEFFNTEVRLPLLRLPVRTVLVNLSSGRVLISPGSQMSPQQLAQAGPVTDIVAPNLFHVAGMQKAVAAYPEARVWGPRGCRKVRSDIAWTHELNESEWPHLQELPFVSLEGMPAVRESVFFHKASKALVVTDLCFNLIDAKGLGPFLILGLFGTYRKFGISRFFLKGVKNREDFIASLSKLLKFSFEQIIPSHGAIVETKGREILLQALSERGYHLQ